MRSDKELAADLLVIEREFSRIVGEMYSLCARVKLLAYDGDIVNGRTVIVRRRPWMTDASVHDMFAHYCCSLGGRDDEGRKTRDYSLRVWTEGDCALAEYGNYQDAASAASGIPEAVLLDTSPGETRFCRACKRHHEDAVRGRLLRAGEHLRATAVAGGREFAHVSGARPGVEATDPAEAAEAAEAAARVAVDDTRALIDAQRPGSREGAPGPLAEGMRRALETDAAAIAEVESVRTPAEALAAMTEAQRALIDVLAANAAAALGGAANEETVV